MIFELIIEFRNKAIGLNNTQLIGFGLAAVLAGLFIWLGGLGFRRVLFAIVGAAIGSSGAYFVAGPALAPIAISAAVGAVIAAIIEKVAVAIIAATLATAFVFVTLDKFIVNFDFDRGLNEALNQTPVYGWLVAAVVAVIFVLASFHLRRFVSALCCSTLGTLLIFAGMILLLFYKGVGPVNRIESNPSLYSAIFIVMTAFGASVQLLLCEKSEGKPVKKSQAPAVEQAPQQKQANWRMQ
ncbi:MAG: hypothetical protein ACYTBJ_13790 [Planctomycetota bacterium]|jgi:hypothetical protein